MRDLIDIANHISFSGSFMWFANSTTTKNNLRTKLLHYRLKEIGIVEKERVRLKNRDNSG